ncbi:MAG: DEAD/DEAH box helicase [Elusimicrobia bacterium]|nr:DEAD/DEAH box helicase [Elusimicrobiota bacterium]
MDLRGDLDLGSYDRFFPNQDFVPKGGFGNLIAMPLQKKCRAIGNTEFLDGSSTELRAYPDQWAFLSSVQRLTPQQLNASLEVIPFVTIGPGKIESTPEAIRAGYPAPKQIRCEFFSSFSLEKSGIPPWMLSKLKHLASLHNPEFYKMQKLRRSTHMLTRFIKCYREDFSHFHLPRGTREDVNEIARQAGSELICIDRRKVPEPLSLQFHGSLSPEQEKAVQTVLREDMGLLVAPPGAGKTVMGCFAIAKRNLPTLILAHRKPILEQWRKQLTTLLDLEPSQIGRIGGGKKEQNGIIDLAMLQTLARLEDLSALFSKYGFIIVDECHHLPAATFEACIREAPTRYILGLTATPYRRDGLQDILIMQCGPVRHKMSEQMSNLPLQLNVRETEFVCPTEEDTPIQEIFRGIVHDDTRSTLIEQDISAALKQGRRCLVLSQWNEHCRALADKLARKGTTPFVLSGTQGKKERAAILKSIQDTPPDKDLIVVATGQYLGEGFDCPQLDTLFLAFPVSFKGKLIQYVGRIMREHPSKKRVLVYDYRDSQVPVLNKMHARRLKTYKALGFNRDNRKEMFL